MKYLEIVDISDEKTVFSLPIHTLYLFRFLSWAIFNKHNDIFLQKFNGEWYMGWGWGEDSRVLILPKSSDGDNLMIYIRSICHPIENMQLLLGSADGIGQIRIYDELVSVIFYFRKNETEDCVIMRLLYGMDAPKSAFTVYNKFAGMV